MNTHDQEKYLVHAMNLGFSNAADSFSKLLRTTMKVVNSNSVLLAPSARYAFLSEEEGDLYVLVTKIIGEVTGKSFLILNESEAREIFSSLNGYKENNLQEAFLLEIDNILSASVISKLAEAFQVEIYGDVPRLMKLNAKDLDELVHGDFDPRDPQNMVFSNVSFQFDAGDHIHPQFIWKISHKIFDLTPSAKT